MKPITATQRKRLIREWLLALLSGKFKQSDGALKRVNLDTGRTIGYCCLGVLAETVKRLKLVPLRWAKHRSLFVNSCPLTLPKEEGDGIKVTNTAYLPDRLSEILGLTHEQQTPLAVLNDDEVPFPIIALKISETLGVKLAKKYWPKELRGKTFKQAHEEWARRELGGYDD